MYYCLAFFKSTHSISTLVPLFFSIRFLPPASHSVQFGVDHLKTRRDLSKFETGTDKTLCIINGIDLIAKANLCLFLCRGDVSPGVCRDCIDDSTKNLKQNCTHNKESIVWYEECMLRYSNHSIFATEEEMPWRYWCSLNKVSNTDQFNQSLSTLMNGLVDKAAFGNTTPPFFATGDDNCQVRYGSDPFCGEGKPIKSGGGRGKNKSFVAVAAVLCMVLSGLLVNLRA
ncbi:cysteine-rich repeat secretory protein 4-like isoform X1 [Prunus yedoensis var. nudiflora]|uniref:Cysteine-rich repeat secretory protein 4-like isoform X1 n=1 Tax=Prunus yedoensis var. nudiflora TaxID=2094558 RepID=A0A314ZLE0_PRUYE|nr:cysteine-rich repeat secretory protein 4-like isoform X1 [Prunus yedoensis var. nudiflora]